MASVHKVKKVTQKNMYSTNILTPVHIYHQKILSPQILYPWHIHFIVTHFELPGNTHFT